MAVTVDAANEMLATLFAPWVRALGLQVTQISAEGAVMEMAVTEDMKRVGDMVCGQALATMADTAMVFAAIGERGGAHPFATTNLDTQFLRAAGGDSIRCEARVVRAGRAVVFAEATMLSMPSGKPVATAQTTMFVP